MDEPLNHLNGNHRMLETQLSCLCTDLKALLSVPPPLLFAAFHLPPPLLSDDRRAQARVESSSASAAQLLCRFNAFPHLFFIESLLGPLSHRCRCDSRLPAG